MRHLSEVIHRFMHPWIRPSFLLAFTLAGAAYGLLAWQTIQTPEFRTLASEFFKPKVAIAADDVLAEKSFFVKKNSDPAFTTDQACPAAPLPFQTIQLPPRVCLQVGEARVIIPLETLTQDTNVLVRVVSKSRTAALNRDFIPLGKAVEVVTSSDLNRAPLVAPPSDPLLPKGITVFGTLASGLSFENGWDDTGDPLLTMKGQRFFSYSAYKTAYEQFQDPGFIVTNSSRSHWEDPNAKGRFAILIHGINNNENRLADLRDALIASGVYADGGIGALRYDYSEGPIPASDYLRSYLQSHGKLSPDVSIDFYVSSFGGIVSRYFMTYDDIQNAPRRLFSMASPHLGTPWKDPSKLFEDLLLNGADQGLYYHKGDATIQWLKKDYEPLQQMNRDWIAERRANVAVRTVVGTRYPDQCFVTLPFGYDGLFCNVTIAAGFNMFSGDYERNDGAVLYNSAIGLLPSGERLFAKPDIIVAKYDHHMMVPGDPAVIAAAVQWAREGSGHPSIVSASDSSTPNIVSGSISTTPPPVALHDQSQFVRWPFAADSQAEAQPARRDVGLGDSFTITLATKNTGTTTWRASDGYGLTNDVANDGLANLPRFIPVNRDVAPGDVFTYDFTLKAPTLPVSQPIRTTYRMAKHGQEFGPYQDWDVAVAGAAVSFFQDASVNSPLAPETVAVRQVRAGTDFDIEVYIKNTGGSTLKKDGGWVIDNNFATNGYKTAGSGTVAPNRLALDHDVLPGQTWTVRYQLQAPGNNGTNTLTLKMFQLGGSAEDYLNIPIIRTGEYLGFEDEYLVGDWNYDGRATLAVRRDCQLLMDNDFDTSHDRSVVFGCGVQNDQFLIGDWDGDGDDDLAVRRGGVIHEDTGRDAYGYGNGNEEDQYMVGDYNGDGRDEIWIRRGCGFLVDTARDGGGPEVTLSYGCGVQNDQYLIGNWDGSGGDDLAVRRGGTLHYATRSAQTYGSGNAEDDYLVGDWDGDGRDTVAVRRGATVLMDLNFDGSHDILQVYGQGMHPPVVQAYPGSTTATSPLSIMLTTDKWARIYVTTDGSEPSRTSNVYDRPITITATTTLRYLAIDSAGQQSVGEILYRIQ